MPSLEIIEDDITNYLGKKHAGIGYLRLGNYNEASAYFQQLGRYSLVSNPAFYGAPTLLKQNHPVINNKQPIVAVGNYVHEKQTAQQWLDRKW
jgi:hypothetical protein